MHVATTELIKKVAARTASSARSRCVGWCSWVMSCLQWDDRALLLSVEPTRVLKAVDTKPFLSDLQIAPARRTRSDYVPPADCLRPRKRTPINWGSTSPASKAVADNTLRAVCVRALAMGGKQ